MHDRKTMEIERLRHGRPHERTAVENVDFTPRLWMIMIPCMIPFLMIAVRCFEALERMGPVWAVLAAPMLMTTTAAYVALFFLLKKRNL